MTYTNTTSGQSFGQPVDEQLAGLPLFDPSAAHPGPQTSMLEPPPWFDDAPPDDAPPPLDNGYISGRKPDRVELAKRLIPAKDPNTVAKVTLGPGGVKARYGVSGKTPPAGGMRGKIHGFSKGSRRRMQALNAKVDWSRYPAYFCGLTYHEDFELDYSHGSAHKAALRKRLDRKFGDLLIAVEWRKEYKERQSGTHEGQLAPHFHLVILLDIEIGATMLHLILGRMWHEVIEETSEAHLFHGCDVQKCYNTSGGKVGKLMTYLSKYVSKVQDGGLLDAEGKEIDTGRSWGVWGQLPISAVFACMNEGDYITFLRRLRRWSDNRYANKLSVKWRGFLLFGDGEGMQALLRDLQSVQIVA